MIKLDWSNTEFLFALVNENRNIIEFFEVKPIFTTDGSCFIVETNEIMYEAGPWEIYIKPVTVAPKFTQAMADAAPDMYEFIDSLIGNGLVYGDDIDKAMELTKKARGE